MATINPETFQSSANLALWFKINSGEALNLADVPEIIPLRWNLFRDQWPTLRRRLEKTAASSFDPDYFRVALEDLNTFIEQERYAPYNPFSGNNIYYRFYPVFEAILIDQVSPTYEEQQLLQRKRAEVRAYAKNDFIKIKKDITAYRDYVADTVGLTDPDYNRIYDRGAAAVQASAGIADLNLMLVLQQQIGAVDFILANLFAVDVAIDPFALARLNAQNPDLKIGRYSSGFLVRLYYGEDLQGLANRYLKDPDKWIDIAIANGLREPYIDEIGEEIFLVTNGRGTQLNISALDGAGTANVGKLHVNQIVYIQSNANPFPNQRFITGIKEIPISGELVLTLSGDADLDTYLLADNASIRVFKPNTVNSSQFVLIPSSTPLDDTRQDEIPWFMQSAGRDEKRTKIDLAVDEDGSLLFTSNGDLALSYGLANAIQATKLKLMTEQGSNRYHPKYGIINLTGTPNLNEEDVKRLLTDSISAQIQADIRFDRVESLSVERTTGTTGVGFNINLVVRLAGSNALVPISFSVAT